MNATRWERIKAAFSGALDLPLANRAAFLDGAQLALEDRAEVEALLAAHEDPPSLLEDAPLAGFPVDAGGDAAAPERVGPYRIERRLGRGGMGSVYLAHRDDGAYEQAVAIKLIRRGLDTDDVVARFRRERQILAGLDHPNIARLLDGGATDEARPYFVLEYVEGDTITAYADRLRLSITQRLRLFAEVCAAVQFAHGRLIVHRDLKPSNVLVTPEGQVKLLDFGIAKLLGDEADSVANLDSSDGHPITQPGARLMTPEYAAPEQVRGEAVTTATDVYQLGVLLYELLTGQRPYRLTQRMRREIERAILVDEPTRPSTAVATESASTAIGGTASDTAATRATSTDALRRSLRGDLDTIVLKALRKEPADRYDGASAFAEDLRRHLAGLPVTARASTRSYRVRKFVQRHRGGVIAAGLVTLALVIGLSGTLWQARAAATERDRATAERDRAEELNQFFRDLFAANTPNVNRGTPITAADLLGRARVRLDTAAMAPLTRARLLRELAVVYLWQERHSVADTLLGESLATLRALSAEPSAPDDLISELAETHSDYARAVAYLEVNPARIDSVGRAAFAFFQAHADRISPDLRDDFYATEALRASTLEDHDRALDMQRLLLATRRERYATPHRSIAEAHLSLGRALQVNGDLDEATTHLHEAQRQAKQVVDSPNSLLLNIHSAKATLHYARGETADALREAESAADQTRTLHPDRPDLVTTELVKLATLYQDTGHLDRAEVLLRETLALDERTYGPGHPNTLNSAYGLGRVLLARGDYVGAEAIFRRCAAGLADAIGPESPPVAYSLANVARAVHQQGRTGDAEALYRDAIRLHDAAFGGDHPRTANPLNGLGQLLAETSRLAAAEAVLRRAEALGHNLPDGHWRAAYTRGLLGHVLVLRGDSVTGTEYLRESLAAMEAARGADHPQTQHIRAYVPTLD